MEDTRLAVNPNPNWQAVLRVVSMSGGLVAVNEPGPNVQIRAGKKGKTIHTLQISADTSLFHALQETGFHLIGTTFVVNENELKGLQRPQFWAFSPSKGWLAWDVKQKWRQITFAAAKADKMPLMDMASRIASGLTYAESRLLDLATAYSIQLGARLHENDAKEYERFKDTNSFAVYKAINALFWEMAVLRDTLAEFAASFCFSLVGIRTMRRLCKSLATAPFGDSLADEILHATDQASGGMAGEVHKLSELLHAPVLFGTSCRTCFCDTGHGKSPLFLARASNLLPTAQRHRQAFERAVAWPSFQFTGGIASCSIASA
jgi:hypothetical protein